VKGNLQRPRLRAPADVFHVQGLFVIDRNNRLSGIDGLADRIGDIVVQPTVCNEWPAAKVDCSNIFRKPFVACARNEGTPIPHCLEGFQNVRFEMQDLEAAFQSLIQPGVDSLVEDGVNFAPPDALFPSRRRWPRGFFPTASPFLDFGEREPVKRQDFGYRVMRRVVDAGGSSRSRSARAETSSSSRRARD